MRMKNDKTYKANLKKWSKCSKDTTITKKIYRSTQDVLERLMDFEEKETGVRPTFVKMVDMVAIEGMEKRGLK
jgi:uncharacterized protein (UPF0147 family)